MRLGGGLTRPRNKGETREEEGEGSERGEKVEAKTGN